MKDFLKKDEAMILIMVWITLLAAVALTLIDIHIKNANVELMKKLEERLRDENYRIVADATGKRDDRMDHVVSLAKASHHPSAGKAVESD